MGIEIRGRSVTLERDGSSAQGSARGWHSVGGVLMGMRPKKPGPSREERVAFVRPYELRRSAHGSDRSTTRADSRALASVEVDRCSSAAFRRFRCPRF